MKSILVLSISLFCGLVQAAELYWIQMPAAPQKVIIPAEPGNSFTYSLEKYFESIEASEELKPFVKRLKQFREELEWGPLESSSQKRVLLLANKIEDHGRKADRVMSFQKTFEEAGAEVFVLPIAAMKAVASQNRVAVMNVINEQMDVVVSMGGDDIDPELYDEQNTHSTSVRPQRDKYEAMLLSHLIQREKVFIVGVCRGHQIIAAILGQKLIQHIPGHMEGRHEVKFENTKLTGLKGVMEVNTLHHQAVDFNDNGKLYPTAYAPDGTLEAYEFTNGKGFGVQFHPELMEEKWAKDLLKKAVELSGPQDSNSCNSLLKAS